MTTAADLVASTVMDKAASLLNDTAKSNYTYVVQIPYLNIALQELQEIFELNEVPVTATISAAITVPAGTTAVGYSPDPVVPNTPYLPDDFIEPKQLWERISGEDPYIPMTKVDVLPRYMEGVELSQFIVYVWQSQELRFLAANADIDLKIDYIKNLFTEITDEDDTINVVNAATFLEFRTAGLCAEFIGENPTRAQSLNNNAALGLDRVTGIGTKGRQNITIRRRPFRSSFKRRGNFV